MKKIVLTLLVVIGALNTTLAQKEKKYEKIIYKDSKTENSEVIITVDNAVGLEKETKFKLKITNKTNDYILYKPEESKFIINGKEMAPTEKWLLVLPNDNDYITINVKGGPFNSVTNYTFQLDGLYKVSSNAKGLDAPDFRLPATKNDFTAGNFNCNLSKLTKETEKTSVKFSCTYTGDKIGFVFPSKTSVKMPDGNEYANAKSKEKPIFLTKGKSDDFKLVWDRMQGGKSMDMQFVEMFIKWNNTFVEVSPEKMKPETLPFLIDDTLSK